MKKKSIVDVEAIGEKEVQLSLSCDEMYPLDLGDFSDGVLLVLSKKDATRLMTKLTKVLENM